MKKTAFERYAPFIQEYIYRKKWQDLREVQVEACEAILDTKSHVIIASGTASGKTEAAFFPILTFLNENPPDSIGVIYIGPLKALINDQFSRLTELLEEVDIPVWSWHGDVSQSQKKKALQQARGILQITPESLEALLMRHPNEISRLFSDLRFVVIDEIHALMGEDRGLQVLCLLNRLEVLTGCHPRRIGLSATLSDYEPAMRFLSAGSNVPAVAVGVQSHKRTLSLCIDSFSIPAEEEGEDDALAEYNSFLYDVCHLQKCLIFTNSRATAEKTIGDLKKVAQDRGEPDVFYVHHGSVSASLRKEAEEALKENDGPTVAAATLTLELGIDIGDLDSTLQIGAPFTCSGFVQRLGRSGRRSGKSKMMFLNLYEENSEDGALSALPWDLLRSIAIIQLYLEERWVEPFSVKKKPFSMLAHQSLSTLMSCGELSPAELAGKVLTLPPFRETVSAEEYRLLLRFMLEKEYLQRMDNGNLIVGLKGERICNYFGFYAVFQEEEVFRVLSSAGEVGTLNTCPSVNELFVLGGRPWKVISIDEKRKTVHVEPSGTSQVPTWEGRGCGHIHPRIIRRIKEVLQEDTVYSYLQPKAAALLQQARDMARRIGILEHDVIPCGPNTFCICPWVGTKEIATITRLFSCGLKERLDIRSVSNSGLYLTFTTLLEKEALKRALETLSTEEITPEMVLEEGFSPRVDKYDYMIPEELLRTAFLANQTDVPEAISILKNLRL